jgi:hypothetical protein
MNQKSASPTATQTIVPNTARVFDLF